MKLIVPWKALLIVLGNVSSVVAASTCSISRAEIKLGDGGDVQSVIFPNQLRTLKVLGLTSIKFLVKLGESCNDGKVVQSNMVLSSVDKEHLVYFPIPCRQGSCQIAMNAVEALVKQATYNLKLMFAISSTEKDKKYHSMEWNLGEFDFTDATIANAKTGTSDQQEDVFEKTEKENRPPYTTNHRRGSIVRSLIMSGIVSIIPVYFLLTTWKRIDFNKASLKSTDQRALWGIFLAWFITAIFSCLLLDIFMTLKIGAVLTLPTGFFAIRALRPSKPLAKDSGKEAEKKGKSN